MEKYATRPEWGSDSYANGFDDVGSMFIECLRLAAAMPRSNPWTENTRL
jgi:hypothetical protein